MGTFNPFANQFDCLPCGTNMVTLDNIGNIISGATSQDECFGDCDVGTYWNGIDCVDCAKGSYQDKSYQTSCVYCIAGYTTPTIGSESDSDCFDPCADGLTWDGEECVACGLNRYRDRTNQNQCQDCDAGLVTVTDTAITDADCKEPCVAFPSAGCQSNCQKGSYFDFTDLECKECPVGKFQALPNQYYCDDCQPGKTTNGITSDSEQACIDVCDTPGQVLEPGGTSVDDCVDCPKGSYHEGTICLQCPQGKTTETTGSLNQNFCILDCKAGEERSADGSMCVPCPKDKYQTEADRIDGVCKPCPTGKGTKGPGATSLTECNELCGSGLELGTNGDCVACAQGYYRNASVHDTCQACPEGYSTAGPGTSINDCKHNCPAGSFYSSLSQECEVCPPGKYQSMSLMKSCDSCPSWKTTLEPGATSRDQCVDVCGSGYEYDGDVCDECPRGEFRTQNVHDECQPCDDQHTTLATASTSKNDCVPICSPGTYYNNIFLTCVQCEEGTYNPEPYQSECLPCPADKPLSMPHRRSCRANCSVDEQWNEARQICNWCTEGQYKAGGVCTNCPLGWSVPGESATSVDACVLCPSGQYRNNTSVALCQPCPTDLISSVDRTACIVSCEAGRFYNIASGTCVPCPQSTYNSMVGQESCTPCPDGKHTNGEGKTSDLDCRLDWCDAGYLYVEATRSCVPCGVGFYRSDSDATCQPCPAGKTTITSTAGSVTHCVDAVGPVSCQGGNIFNTTSGRCVPCGNGFYRHPTRDETCKRCPTGSSTESNMATSISDCKHEFPITSYRVDLAIAVDMSSSATPADRDSLRTFLQQTINHFRLRINDHDTHVAIIMYARGVRTLTDLQSGCRLQRVVACLDHQLDVSRFNIVNTGFALHRVKEVFSRSGRRNVRKHLLLISDDSSRNPAMSLKKADLLKRAGVGITVIGSDATEVSRLASSSRDRFIITNYSSMPAVMDVLTSILD